MSEPCRDWRGDIAALALDRLQPDERTRALAHVDSCTGCRAELTVLQDLSRAMAHADATRLDHEPAPPPELRDRIMLRLNDERAAARRSSRRRLQRVLAAVAAVVLVASSAGLLLRDRGDSDRVPFEFALPATNGSFALHRNSTGTSITLSHEGLDPHGVYWLWLTDATGKRVAAGTFFGTIDASTVTMQAALPLDRVVRVWVTDEDDAVILDETL
jgi:hypothetical protein